MAYDQLMQTYLGVGLLADRPTAPNVKAGVGAFYYAKDMAALYVWDGATWQALYGGLGKIDEVVVPAGGQADITFTGIAPTYSYLQLLLHGRSTASVVNTAANVQFNDDTAANYDWCEGWFESRTTGSDGLIAQTSCYLGKIPGATGPADEDGFVDVLIMNNSHGPLHKALRAIDAEAFGATALDQAQSLNTGHWHSTAAISSLRLFLNDPDFAEGTVASLYGLA